MILINLKLSKKESFLKEPKKCDLSEEHRKGGQEPHSLE